MSLPALLHPDVVDFLRTNKEEYLKASVWECINKLKQQQFDGGLRVKKLKGIAKKVWEARVTKAIRLIFTYDKSRQPETGEAQVYIAVQDICLEHYDVSRRAKARKKTPDSEWLEAELIEEIGSLENDFFTSEKQLAIQEAQAEELQIVPDFADELLGNIQWRVIDSELEWQRAIIQQDADLPLKLTPEEYELVKLYGNLLLSGSAGTGKTTVGLYRLLKSLETLPDGKRLYVAYNPILLKEAQKQFKRLINGSNADIESIFHFKTIRDLCLDILSVTGQKYFPEDEVTYQIFEQFYRRQSYQPYSPALVWDEIRSIIKGAHLETSSYQLSQKQYEQLGKKRSSVIPQKDRYKAYKVAEWYQSLLKKEERFDEIDLARKVLQLIWQGKGTRYQLIVCDEVQDFSELQLELLIRLVTPGGHLFFAGDLHQMISPSGFRWEDLKTKFFKGQREAVQKTLNFNFRSVGSLVNLANQILKLRYRLLQERISDIGQPSSSYGECARLVSAPLATLQPSLGQLNPDDAILVRTDADKQKFSQEFQSSFVFTIEEAKGLEFDTVFLVEFFKPRQSLWNKVLSSKSSLNKNDEPELRLELNLLYVAVTRARRILNIWETQLSAIWSQSELVNFLQLINFESVKENRVEPTEEMWRQRGFYYLDCGFYRQASECFEKSGDIELHWQTMAKLLLQERQYSEAAQLFVDLQNWQQAAQLFEKASQWKEAAKCWVKVGDSERHKFCEIKAIETAEMWEDAARLWEEIGRFEDAKRCWLKSDNAQKKAEIRAIEFEQKEQWLKAAEQYELARMLEKAQECRNQIISTSLTVANPKTLNCTETPTCGNQMVSPPSVFSPLPIKIGDKWSYIDNKGRIVVQPQFDQADKFFEKLASVKIDGKYGYIDQMGEMVISPQFEVVGRFVEGLAWIAADDKYGYIDNTGQIVISPQFDDAHDFSEGLASVEIDGKYGYIDKTGQIVIAPKFNSAYYFAEGMAIVFFNKKWRYIDRKGCVAISHKFDMAPDRFFDGLARVQVNNKYGFIDKTGRMVIKPQFAGAGFFCEELAWVHTNEYNYGYIDKTGQVVIPLQFDGASDFCEGLACVYNGGRSVQIKGKWFDIEKSSYGYINSRGQVVIPFLFAEAGDFCEGLASVKIHKNQKWGYINQQGQVVIEPLFDQSSYFYEGVALVKVNGRECYIDKEGKIISP